MILADHLAGSDRESVAFAILGDRPLVRMVHVDKTCSGHPWAVAAMEAETIEGAEENAREILADIEKGFPCWRGWGIEYTEAE